MEKNSIYLCIDLKSFYASVECIERKRDSMMTNLVVADPSRTEKTICLAVSPALKSFGVPGRPRLFEVVQKGKEINAKRIRRAPGHNFTGASDDITKLSADLSLKLDYIVAPEDIHVYSIDEVFIDITDYLRTYQTTPRELAMRMIKDVLHETGITAAAGIGTNKGYRGEATIDRYGRKIPKHAHGVLQISADRRRLPD